MEAKELLVILQIKTEGSKVEQAIRDRWSLTTGDAGQLTRVTGMISPTYLTGDERKNLETGVGHTWKMNQSTVTARVVGLTPKPKTDL